MEEVRKKVRKTTTLHSYQCKTCLEYFVNTDPDFRRKVDDHAKGPCFNEPATAAINGGDEGGTDEEEVVGSEVVGDTAGETRGADKPKARQRKSTASK